MGEQGEDLICKCEVLGLISNVKHISLPTAD